MNADRLLVFSKDFVAEYDSFNILALLQQVRELCTTRPPTNSAQFVANSDSLREQAKQIAQKSRFSAYPKIYLDAVAGAHYLRLLPWQVANNIIAGLTSDVATTFSTRECDALLTSATAAYNDLFALTRTLQKLGVKSFVLDDEKVSVEFSLPRISFDNTASGYFAWNERVNSIISAFNEFVGHEEKNAKLVFTSTTDPVIGFAVCLHTAYAVVKLFSGLLVLGKNAVELYSSLQKLREHKMGDSTQFETTIEQITKDSVQNYVEETLKMLKTSADEGRSNEIRNQIVIHATLLVPIIIDGASLSISPESLQKLNDAKLDLVGEDNAKFLLVLADNQSKEGDLRAAVRLAGGQNLMRLTQSESRGKDGMGTSPT